MAGQTVRILPRTDYDFSGLATGSTATVVIARKLDTSRWREAIIMMRLHAATWPASSQVTLTYGPDGYTDEDPAAIWNTTPNTLLVFVQGSDAPPNVKVGSLSVPFGPLVKLNLLFVTAAAAGTFKPSISVDLNLKGE